MVRASGCRQEGRSILSGGSRVVSSWICVWGCTSYASQHEFAVINKNIHQIGGNYFIFAVQRPTKDAVLSSMVAARETRTFAIKRNTARGV